MRSNGLSIALATSRLLAAKAGEQHAQDLLVAVPANDARQVGRLAKRQIGRTRRR